MALLAIAAPSCDSGGSGTKAAPAERHLVYVTGESGAAATVWIAGVDGSHPRRLTRGSAGVLSPDGQTVAVARRDGIYLVSSDGTRERLLTTTGSKPQRWANDGKSLLVATRTSLTVVDRRSGRSRVIARGPIYGFDLEPNGDRVVYSRAPRKTDEGICGDQFDLYVAKLGGGTPTQLTHDGLSAFPVWGSRIAFARVPGPTYQDCAAPGIWTMDSDGSDAEPILERSPEEFAMSGFYGLQPVGWLADDRLLVGIRTEWGTKGAVLDTQTGRLRPLRDYVDKASSDGRFALGGGGDEELVAIARIQDGKRVITVKNACCPDWNR